MMKAQYIDHMGDDSSVVRAARVSFANDQTLQDIKRDKSLINYLAKHNHWTPFSHTAITLRMTAPVPIRTQAFKHKVGFTENEESRRYISYTPEYIIPEFRMSSPSKKQGSGSAFDGDDQKELQQLYLSSVKAAVATYEALLQKGVCEEQARFVLPQGTLVHWYWTGSLSAYARFFKQRTDPHAQQEIQELAHAVGSIIKPLFPYSWSVLTGEEL